SGAGDPCASPRQRRQGLACRHAGGRPDTAHYSLAPYPQWQRGALGFMSVHLPVHDPGFLPWFIVTGYLVAALLTFRAGSVADGRERILWLGTGVALILLGINKQLDLQSDLTWAAK